MNENAKTKSPSPKARKKMSLAAKARWERGDHPFYTQAGLRNLQAGAAKAREAKARKLKEYLATRSPLGADAAREERNRLARERHAARKRLLGSTPVSTVLGLPKPSVLPDGYLVECVKEAKVRAARLMSEAHARAASLDIALGAVLASPPSLPPPPAEPMPEKMVAEPSNAVPSA
jgi:hypothetical protein